MKLRARALLGRAERVDALAGGFEARELCRRLRLLGLERRLERRLLLRQRPLLLVETGGRLAQLREAHLERGGRVAPLDDLGRHRYQVALARSTRLLELVASCLELRDALLLLEGATLRLEGRERRLRSVHLDLQGTNALLVASRLRHSEPAHEEADHLALLPFQVGGWMCAHDIGQIGVEGDDADRPALRRHCRPQTTWMCRRAEQQRRHRR